MAVDMFLKIEGVDGESKDKAGHGGEIDVVSFQWHSDNPSSTTWGGGGGTGKVNVAPLRITKRVDKSTPLLALKCADGTPFKEAKLVLRKAGTKPLEYMTYVMSNVLISSYDVDGAALATGDVPTEQIALSFDKVQMIYLEQDDSGGKKGEIKQTWDVKGNISA